MTQNTKTSFKPTQIPWIGNIPEDWDCKRLKYAVQTKKGRMPKKIVTTNEENHLPYITASSFEKYSYDNFISIEEDLVIVEKDDVIILWDGARAGFIDYGHYGFLSSTMVAITPNSLFNRKFFYYFLKSQQKLFQDFANGTTIPHADGEILNNTSIPLPPLSTQTAIANFLDQKTEKISTLISNKKKLINLLKEQKQSIIHRAVTKGIDPNVKMKESGIPWIGEIPEDWETAKMKQIVSIKISDGPHETPDFFQEGVPFASAESVFNGKINFESIRGFISKAQDKIYSQKCKPQRNDIFIVKSGSTTGKIAVVEEDIDFNIWSPLALVRVNRNLCYYKFVYYFLISESFQKQVQTFWSFGTQPNIGMGVIENLHTALPSINIQKAIVEYITQETSQIGTAIEKIEKEITLIEEYQISLIYQAVTGKISIS